MFEGVSVIDDLGHRIPALGPKALGLECGALGRQYPLTPSNMGLEYLNHGITYKKNIILLGERATFPTVSPRVRKVCFQIGKTDA